MLGMKGHFSTAIIKLPTGRYSLAGSVPVALAHLSTKSLSYPPPYVPNVYETEQEVINALLALGITHFQLNDCSWYDKKG